MCRDDELRSLPGGYGPQLVMDGVLEDEVQMRIRFVQEQHGALLRIEEREQHRDLLKSAAGACDVQPWPALGHGVFREDMGTARVGRLELVAEQLADGRLQRTPRALVPVGLHKQVADDLTGAAETEKLLDFRRWKQWLVNPDAGHGRHEHGPQIECTQRLRGSFPGWPDMDLLGAVGDELHRHRPAQGNRI